MGSIKVLIVACLLLSSCQRTASQVQPYYYSTILPPHQMYQYQYKRRHPGWVGAPQREQPEPSPTEQKAREKLDTLDWQLKYLEGVIQEKDDVQRGYRTPHPGE